MSGSVGKETKMDQKYRSEDTVVETSELKSSGRAEITICKVGMASRRIQTGLQCMQEWRRTRTSGGIWGQGKARSGMGQKWDKEEETRGRRSGTQWRKDEGQLPNRGKQVQRSENRGRT
jgi:hypothetical protein